MPRRKRCISVRLSDALALRPRLLENGVHRSVKLLLGLPWGETETAQARDVPASASDRRSDRGALATSSKLCAPNLALSHLQRRVRVRLRLAGGLGPLMTQKQQSPSAGVACGGPEPPAEKWFPGGTLVPLTVGRPPNAPAPPSTGPPPTPPAACAPPRPSASRAARRTTPSATARRSARSGRG